MEKFSVSAVNPLLGLDNRTNLLNRLGSALLKKSGMFCRDGTSRPGELFDYLSKKQVEGQLKLAIFSSHYCMELVIYGLMVNGWGHSYWGCWTSQ